jgi:hypothetical protein
MQNPYPTKILDVRPDGHQSLSTIPRFMEGDFDRLQHHWKFEILFDHGYERASSGELFWGIDTIEVKPGPSTLQPQVRDLNNNLITTPPGILMFNHWPGAPQIEFNADPRYFDRAVVGFTEGNGSIGWGFGGESWINAADPSSHNGGPYSVWCSAHPENFQPPQDRVIGSDCLSRIGWWDDHIVINGLFRMMRKAGAIPPPSGDSRLAIYQGGIVRYVSLTNGSGNGERIVIEIDGNEVAYVETKQL